MTRYREQQVRQTTLPGIPTYRRYTHTHLHPSSSRRGLKALQPPRPTAGSSPTRNALRKPLDDAAVAQALLLERPPDEHAELLVAVVAAVREPRHAHARHGYERDRRRRVLRQALVRDVRPPRVVERPDVPPHLRGLHAERFWRRRGEAAGPRAWRWHAPRHGGRELGGALRFLTVGRCEHLGGSGASEQTYRRSWNTRCILPTARILFLISCRRSLGWTCSSSSSSASATARARSSSSSELV